MSEETNPGEVTRAVQKSLETIARINPNLNAFTLLIEQEALKTAAELDSLPVSQRGPLHGMIVAIKDENDVRDTPTSFGTACNVSTKDDDSLTVARLRKAGAVILGKTTMPAFGTFPFTESEAFGLTRNPYNPDYTPGGSSGGSAVAVASGMVQAALGGDGGGSIRIPAAHCGLVGFKPARGTVPTAPYEHLWHDLGVAGPLTRSVSDAEKIYRVLSGQMSEGTTRSKKLRIALKFRPDSPLAKLEPAHRRALWETAQKLRSLGHEVVAVNGRTPDPTLVFAVQFLAGLRDEILSLENPEKIERLHSKTRLLASWVSPRVLAWAKERGEKISVRLEDLFFEDFDLLLTATTAQRPLKVGQLGRGGFVRQMLASVPSVAYTLLWNVAGNPALALPAGWDDRGLPLSVQLVASRAEGAENLLFELGKQLEAL